MDDVKHCSQLVLQASAHTISMSKEAICMPLLAFAAVLGYLIRNCSLALMQCMTRDLFLPEMITTFKGGTPACV